MSYEEKYYKYRIISRYQEGERVYKNGIARSENPYEIGTTDRWDWDSGWWDAQYDDTN